MNWGGFSGGLANGFQNGIKMGKTYRDLVKEYGLQKLRDEQMAKAKQDAADKAGSLVTETPTQPALQPAQGQSTNAAPSMPQATPGVDNTTASGNAPKPVEAAPLPDIAPAQPAAPAEPAGTPAQPIEAPENALASQGGAYWWNSDN